MALRDGEWRGTKVARRLAAAGIAGDRSGTCWPVQTRDECPETVLADGEATLQAGRAKDVRHRRAGGGQAHADAELPGTALRADQHGQPHDVTRRDV